MIKLSSQWLTDGMLDFEYKKYVLLAYFQHVRGQFRDQMLFPHLPHLRDHYCNSVNFKESRHSLKAKFPKDLTGFDPSALRFIYKEAYEENSHLEEIDDILEFAIPQFSDLMQEGQERYQAVEKNLSISPVGIIPLRTEEGYLFIHQNISRETAIYRYQVTLFDSRRERIIQIHPVDTIHKSLSTTFENLKIALTKKYTQWPNPATYIVESPREYPLDETLLPAAKLLMSRYLKAS
jgi:hypothetical protein